MKILFLTQNPPYPLDAGAKVRNYYVLRYLSQYHEIDLVTFVRRWDTKRPTLELPGITVRTVPLDRSPALDVMYLLSSRFGDSPFLVRRDWNKAMAHTVQELTTSTRYDAVYASQLTMAQYLLTCGSKKILDEINVEWNVVKRVAETDYSLSRRFAARLEWQKVRKYESRIVAAFDHILTVTEDDRDLLAATANRSVSISTLPICIDPETITPVKRERVSNDIVFVGTMYYPPNADAAIWFGTRVFPIIQDHAPESRFIIVGSRPDAAVRKMSQRNPRIVVTGYVNDIGPYLAESAVFVVPLRSGGGMRVKILDAWARGIPIVSTSLGAEGIRVVRGENILIGDSCEDIASHVLRILRDREFADQLVRNGREWVTRHYDWRNGYRALDGIFPPNELPPITQGANPSQSSYHPHLHHNPS